MCGRFTLRTPVPVLIEHFALGRAEPLRARFNIAPTQQVAAVRQPPAAPQRELVTLRWGLIPSWAKEATIGNRMINARGESVAEKPAFRRALRSRRCLVVADGFYEWQKQGRTKQPYFIHLKNHGPFAFAGLWESWRPEGESHNPIETCTIITTQANDLMREIHDRMPVILAPDEYRLWLDPLADDPAELLPLIDPYPSDMLVADPVSTYVNTPRHDDPKCVEVQRASGS